jgi:hypothetical protein
MPTIVPRGGLACGLRTRRLCTAVDNGTLAAVPRVELAPLDHRIVARPKQYEIEATPSLRDCQQLGTVPIEARPCSAVCAEGRANVLDVHAEPAGGERWWGGGRWWWTCARCKHPSCAHHSVPLGAEGLSEGCAAAHSSNECITPHPAQICDRRSKHRAQGCIYWLRDAPRRLIVNHHSAHMA